MSELLIQNLKFDDRGLITAVVQDDASDEILMVAHMNAESLAKTLQTGETWFWSRSRQELWHKGATSGAIQRVVDLRLDCDGDALLVRVNPNGPACHTGERSCFSRGAQDVEAAKSEEPVKTHEKNREKDRLVLKRVESQVSLVNVAAMDLGIQLQDLFKLIQERKDQRPEGSYTSYLFNSGIDKILKKVGEESAETIIAAKNAGDDEGRKQLSSEISDLLYHLLVLMVEREVSLYDIAAELSARAGKPANQKH
ncbi:MAG TPA: bifunctional phosphoribosyl-AMP cyclohydrolase/phosphoribosyl-ATP diphosphatase HisIE [Blastocatellia bacterium]|nr:bifunctional phosphoribosyl-AMP cyclohydrolase/phosphoribosyl-ATP diphosphatase HisIE [Blastocatellia bacterium]